MFKRLDLAIINRSFWPVYPVIGEALMRFAEEQAVNMRVGVVMQDHANIRGELNRQKRGGGVEFYPCHAFSVSGSSILRRAIDAVFFMAWVFLILLLKRPKKVYVSTDPPVLVPFIVMVYCKVFSSKYTYHLQDIHPEAANVVMPVQKHLYRLLLGLDVLTMKYADLIITITDEMANEIRNRSGTRAPIKIVANPSISFDGVVIPSEKVEGFTFCGNAGRLQRMPLLIEAIDKYYEDGGLLPFVFAGGGVFAAELKGLSERHELVEYKGVVTPAEAAELNAKYSWALLPIEDEVTRYAFPSKSSSYVFSGAKILAICGEDTSVASWVVNHKLGCVAPANKKVLSETFLSLEKGLLDLDLDNERIQLKSALGFDVFIRHITELVVGCREGEV